MTSERKLADFRQWALAVLGLLSATPERQAVYLQESGVGADEILLQFDDVLHVARARISDGSLKQEDYLLLQGVNERVDSVNACPDSIWADAALEEAAEWRELQIVAGAVKLSLERSWNLRAGD